VLAVAGEVDMSESLEPVESFKTFNEFFARRLKPEARPIAEPKDDDVVVSAADSRLTVFDSVSDATRFWIKVSRCHCWLPSRVQNILLLMSDRTRRMLFIGFGARSTYASHLIAFRVTAWTAVGAAGLSLAPASVYYGRFLLS
jgi:Phosphatidylserine decarboxylase